MYSRGARERTSSGPEGMRTTSSLNLRYRAASAKTKTLQSRAKQAKLKQKSSKSKWGLATSKLRRALNNSYDLDESKVKETAPTKLEAVSIKRHIPNKASNPIKKRLSLNNTGTSNLERPLTLVTQTPKWKIEEKRRKENLEILTTVQKSTFEEMNTETKESFGRLTPNIVSLKLLLNQEFSSNIDEERRRTSSVESDDSFIELKPIRETPIEGPEYKVSELIKGRNASRLLRTEKELEFVKKAVHNNIRLKQEAKAKKLQQQKFDEEFFVNKISKKTSRKSAVRRLFNKASKNVQSNVSSIKKRLSKGASNISNRWSSERPNSSKTEEEDLDLDDPNNGLTPQNIKKVQMLITRNDVQKMTLELNNKALEREKKENPVEPNVIKPVKRVKNRNSEMAAQRFKEKMEQKRKMSLVDKKKAMRMRRQKHSAKVTHSNVAKLDKLREQKLKELQNCSRKQGNRLHTRKVLHSRRVRPGLSSKRISDLEDAKSMSDSEVSTDSLVELETEGVESLVEEDVESIDSLVEAEIESLVEAEVESLIEEAEIESLIEEAEVESLVEEEVESLVEVEDDESLVELEEKAEMAELSDDEEDSGSVVEVISVEDKDTVEGNSLIDLNEGKRRLESEVEDSDSDDGSVIISNAFKNKRLVRDRLGDSLIELLEPTTATATPRQLLEGSRNTRAPSLKHKRRTRSREKSEKSDNKSRRGTIDGDELPSLSVKQRHPKATQRYSNKRLNF